MQTKAASPTGTPGFAWKAFRASGRGCDGSANKSPESAGNFNACVPLKAVEDTRVELCALIPDDECLITQLLVFQALLVFPSSVAQD